MKFILLILFAFSHFQHKELPCSACHDFKTPKRQLTTKQESCQACHKNKPKKHLFTLKETQGIQFSHRQHAFLSCSTCHEEKNKNMQLPKMKTCTSCHDPKSNSPKPSCKNCHAYKRRFITHYDKKTYIPKSHNRLNYKTKHLVSNENYCLQCHKKSYCTDCHNSASKFNASQKFHPVDYINIHKYDKNQASCSSCHKGQKDCMACHQKSGIDTTKHETKAKTYRIHPKNWNHAKAAYKRISNCVSCHTEKDCLSCHQTGINPHKKLKNICKRSKKEKRSCEKCHQRIKTICP